MKTTEYQRGYNSAKKLVNNGENIEELLNQARGSLTNDDFDKGFKDYLKETQLKNNI